MQTITAQLRLSVHSPQWCLGPNNLIFTCRVLCSAQEEEPETKAIPFDITIPAEDEAFLVNESKQGFFIIILLVKFGQLSFVS